MQVVPVKKKATWRRKGKEQAGVEVGSTCKGEQSAAPKQALVVVAAPDGDSRCGHDGNWGNNEGVMRHTADGEGSPTRKRVRRERVPPFSALQRQGMW